MEVVMRFLPAKPKLKAKWKIRAKPPGIGVAALLFSGPDDFLRMVPLKDDEEPVVEEPTQQVLQEVPLHSSMVLGDCKGRPKRWDRRSRRTTLLQRQELTPIVQQEAKQQPSKPRVFRCVRARAAAR